MSGEVYTCNLDCNVCGKGADPFKFKPGDKCPVCKNGTLFVDCSEDFVRGGG
jgi:hypothetical protein